MVPRRFRIDFQEINELLPEFSNAYVDANLGHED